MKNFFVIAREKNEDSVKLVGRICDRITIKGGRVSVVYNPDYSSADAFHLDDDCECIITIGGDGSLIRAAGYVCGTNIPLLGVNTGHMGYLCDLDANTVVDAIDRLFAGDYSVENRMMICGSVDGDNEMPIDALNDIVIRNSKMGNVVRLAVEVNGQQLFSYDCDGIILATPTGSTAYNLSVSGPVVNPETSLILLTPISPHALSARTIVLDSDDVVCVSLEARNTSIDERADIRFDGSHTRYMSSGQRIIVKKADKITKIIRLSKENFYEKMCNKMRED